VFDLVNLALGELLTIIWRLRTKEVFLDTKWNFFWANEEDDKDRVGITALINAYSRQKGCTTYCQEMLADA
jgi:hypothetical protein